MYKDKDRQREAVKLATRRYRNKGITQIPVTFKGVIPATVIPNSDTVSAMYPSSQRRHSQETQSVVKPQSHNPMMVGYVPPRTA